MFLSLELLCSHSDTTPGVDLYCDSIVSGVVLQLYCDFASGIDLYREGPPEVNLIATQELVTSGASLCQTLDPVTGLYCDVVSTFDLYCFTKCVVTSK